MSGLALASVPARTASSAALAGLPGAGLGIELVRLLLSLLAVAALILLFAWLTRRLQQLQQRRLGSGRRMQCVETLHTGLKERLLLVRVDDTELLLGATPQGLQTLHVLPPRPAGAEAAPEVPPAGFEAVLRRWMPTR